MCLGVPGLVVERDEADDGMASGLVDFAGIRRRVCLACVPDARPGDYVIVHAGIALTLLDATEAGRVFAYLQDVGEDEGWSGQPLSGGTGGVPS